jgi:hypothetical protein
MQELSCDNHDVSKQVGGQAFKTAEGTRSRIAMAADWVNEKSLRSKKWQN